MIAAATLAASVASNAGAAQVRGSVVVPAGAKLATAQGYTRMRVAQPSKAMDAQTEDLAVVLQVKASNRTPPADRVWKVSLKGLRLDPYVIACATDASASESVEFTNEDDSPATITIGKEELGTLAPGQSKAYKCQVAGAHTVRVKEWPHVRGYIHIPATLALTTRPAADGSFSVSAPQGTFELQIIGANGVIHTQEVKVDARDLDLGKIEVGSKSPKTGDKPPAQPGEEGSEP